MTAYKLIALDMDGTVLNERQEISPENERWIRHALQAGITVIFSTGRDIRSVLPYVEMLGLNTPIITANGGEIWTKPHVLHKRYELDSQYVKKLHQLVLQYNEPWFWANSVEGLYNKAEWMDPLDQYEQHQWLKFGIYTEDDVVRNELIDEIRSWNIVEITNSSPASIELNACGISKASALHELCEIMNIEMSQVVAMGDSMNDMKAIQQAGLGVAMGNAQDLVKQAADLVTLTNDEHGVADVIQRFVLNS